MRKQTASGSLPVKVRSAHLGYQLLAEQLLLEFSFLSLFSFLFSYIYLEDILAVSSKVGSKAATEEPGEDEGTWAQDPA